MVRRWPLFQLLAITALASLCIAFGVHLTSPMPGYFVDTRTWAASGHILDTFTPLGYPLFLGPAFRLAGVPGIIALQGALQVAIAAVCFFVLRELGVSSTWSALGSLPVALHPDLLLSVVKIWDISLSTFLLLMLVFFCLRLHHRAVSSWPLLAVSIGLVFAAAAFCRPNYILLLPVVFLSFYSRRQSLSLKRVCGYFMISVTVACATFALLGAASHGSPFLSRNGPYNLYAGHNPHTVQSLLTNLNAEPSLGIAYLETHPGVSDPNFFSPSFDSFYIHQSILFARAHPGTELELLPIKLFTLFRPDTKVHRLLSLSGVTKAILAMPVLLVLVTLLLPGGIPIQFNWNDWFLFCVEIVYILPFLITNSDPRFRIPLDALLLLHFVSLLYRRLNPILVAA